MKTRTTKRYREIDYNLDQQLSANNTTDATGLCFAAAVLCAFLTAGIIVYRTGNSDIVTVTAANDVMPAAATAGPIDPAPIMQR
jgi:hypothetical protein